MRRRRTLRQLHENRLARGLLFVCAFLTLALVAAGNLKTSGFINSLSYRVSSLMLNSLSPATAKNSALEQVRESGILSLFMADFPVSRYVSGSVSYEQPTESTLEASSSDDGGNDAQTAPEDSEEEDADKTRTVSSVTETSGADSAGTWTLTEKVNSYAIEKLQDFDYLKQNFYTIDKNTTIGSDELNIDRLLSYDCKLTHDADTPQILIYHTHSQEMYADSAEGDVSTGVVGVGEYLAQILTEEYGLNVIHHTGEYDVENRDNAYSVAGPALQQLLEENPGIEVVIDLHRDGVPEGTRLTTEVNGVTMAPVMFFNGLSRTTSTGDIDYLYNPYLSENLSFSFQLQLTACEYFPGFTRPIYLKSYRYNLHYCPMSLLVEVGAQTNTLQEALNAMEPLAAVLNHVLTEE